MRLKLFACFFTYAFLYQAHIFQFPYAQPSQPLHAKSNLENAKRINCPQTPCGRTTKYTTIENLVRPPAHGSTKVHVISGDTVDAAQEITSHAQQFGGKVVVLNATYPEYPGGNWKKGDISQEETLFLRTGLSRGLDLSHYPLETFTCLYTQDVKVIRLGLNAGYAFIDNGEHPMFDVISMAGVDTSTGNGNNAQSAFTEREAAIVRTKFELMFNTCTQNGADVLVLGTIDCGAFDNPPGAVSAAFRSVIELYAGYFSDIYFVIYNQGTANVFARELVGPGCTCDRDRDTIETCPSCDYNRVFKVLPPPTDVHLKLCEDCGSCTSLDPEHYRTFFHPPFCPYGITCPLLRDQSANNYHCFYFMHKMECPLKGKCTNANDSDHAARFTHPDRCPRWTECQDTSDAHTEEFLHPPMCPKGLLCNETKNSQHASNFRHPNVICPYGHTCRLIHDSRHMRAYAHSFLQPCDKSPYDCTDNSEVHKGLYSHLCKYGPQCRKIGDPAHTRLFYHAGIVCPDGGSCKNMSEEHLQEFWHPGSSLNRRSCRNPWCTDTSPEHRKEFYHLPTRMALSPVNMLNCRDPGNPESYGDFSQTGGARVPFFSNMNKWLRKLNAYIGINLDINSLNFVEIKDWFEQLRPMHMCSADVAISMFKIGAMLSTKEIQALWKNRKDIMDCVFNRETAKEAIGSDPEVIKKLKKYGIKYVCDIQYKMAQDKLPGLMKGLTKNSRAIAIYQNTGRMLPEKIQEKEQERASCVSVYGENLVKLLENEIDGVVNAVSQIIDVPPGRRYESDEIMRTNHTVFSIIGPHYYHYGDTEVVFVLRKTIMWHPDFYMTPGAATSFRTAHYHKGRKPWMGDSKPKDGGAMDDYFREKFSLVDPRWSEAAAKDFICRTLNVELHKPITEASKVTLNEVRQYWSKVDAHAVIEGHLPSLVPLDYVEHVILQRSAYNKIMADPIARAQFSAWKKRYGDGFIEVVNSGVEVRGANDDYLYRTQPIYAPTGYSFAVYGKREQFMPIKFKQDEKRIFIYFMACGGKLSISVSNIGDLSDKKTKREVATFTLDETMQRVTAHFLPPLAAISSKKVGEMMNFNSGCSTSQFVHYVLCVDHNTSTLTFKHWGASTYFNNKELTINFPKGIVYKYLSFTSSVGVEEPPRIWSLSVEYRERLSPIPPLPSEADIQQMLAQM